VVTPQQGDAAQKADINVTPLVDVMLVMLVIFMVTVPFATASIRLDTPPPIAGSFDVPLPDPVYISINEDGSIWVGHQISSIATLAADVCVFIRGQPEVRHRAVMAVMDDLQSHGFYKIGLLNEDIE
jgi:biopolymer transport protein ExbD